MNVADLVIPGVGKLECVPVLPDVTEVQLSPLINDRIGYVMVQFSENLNSVRLLGFVSQLTLEVISIDQIQSLDRLLDLIYLDRLDGALRDRVNNLSKFLAGMLGIGWEPIIVPFAKRLPPQIGSANENSSAIDSEEYREFALRNASVSQLNSSSYDSIQGFTASKIINLRAKIASITLLSILTSPRIDIAKQSFVDR